MNKVEVLQLGPYVYDIDWGYNNQDKWGYHSPMDQKILINKNLKEDMQRQVFLHELIHAAWSASEINTANDKAKEIEEMAVSMLSVHLMTYFKQNPELKGVLFD